MYELVLASTKWTTVNRIISLSTSAELTRSLTNTDSHTYHSFPKAPKGVTLGSYFCFINLVPLPHEVKPYLQNRGHGAEVPLKVC